MVDNVCDVHVEPIESSKYLKPMRIHYKQNGRSRHRDYFRTYDSVAVLLYHSDRRSLVFVKQFRPAVYANQISMEELETAGSDLIAKHPPSAGVTFEVCAGILDKPEKSPNQIAQEEIIEECGYHVPLERIQRITTCRSGVGTHSSLQTFFYAQIDDSMKVSEGGGTESETIEVVYVPVDEGYQLLFDETIPKPAGFMFAVIWFYHEKYNLQTKNLK